MIGLAYLDQLLQAGNDCRYERGRVFTRRRKKPLVAGHRLSVSAVHDASDNEIRHAELATGLDNGRSFHFDSGGAKGVTQCASTSHIRQKHIARNDDSLDDPWRLLLTIRCPNRR